MKIHAESGTTSSSSSSSSSESLTSHLILTTFISTFAGSFHFGFLMSAINPLSHILQFFVFENIEKRYDIQLTSSQISIIWSSIAGCLFFGAIIGSYLSIYLLAKYGPKKSLLIASIILLVSTPIFGFAYDFQFAEFLAVSRICSGVGFGIGIASQVAYSSEVAPVKYRGLVNTIGAIVGNTAYVLAAALGTPFIFGTDQLWKFVFFLQVFPCFIHIICNIFYFHDSPVFLIKNGEQMSAEESIKLYFGEKCDVEKIVNEIRKEQSIVAFKKTLIDILSDRCSIRAFSLSVALNFSVAFSGIVAMSFFGTSLFETIGYSPEASSIANCLTGIPPIFAAVIMAISVDKLGRRLLLIPSLIVLAIINTLMMFLTILNESAKSLLISWSFFILFVLFLFLFSLGVGPAAMFLGAELAPPGVGSKMQSYSISVQFIGSFLCPILYTSIHESIGSYAYLMFILPLSMTALYFYFYLPETKGKTPNEIYDLLRK